MPAWATAQLNPEVAAVPEAAQKPFIREMQGEKFEDPYFWFREKENPALLSYLRANNAYSDAVMKPTEKLQKKLYNEMVGRIQESDLSVPTFDRGYFYYSRTVKGQQYSIHCRRKGSMKAREEILLDLNALAKGKAFLDLGDLEISPNGQMMAYSLDTTGYREYELFFKDLRSGRVLSDRFGKVTGVTWAADNKTLYYTTEEKDTKRPNRLYRRALGSKSANLLYEEKVPQFNLWAGESRDKNYLFVVSASAESSECRAISLKTGDAPMRLIEKRRDDVEYYPDHRAGLFYIRTNDGAKEFRVVVAPADRPGRENWTTILAENAGAKIENIELFEKLMVTSIRSKAQSTLRVTDLKTWKTHTIKFPESYYSAGLGANPDWKAEKLRLDYVSMITPQTVYDYDVRSRKFSQLKQQIVKGYDKSKFATELIWVSVRDGAKVPVAIAYKKGIKKPAPLFLEAYGAYGIANDPYFSSSMVSLTERGVIIGTALVRGGGEMGETWHDDGKMEKKINTFLDFIDVGKWMIFSGWTTSAQLGITGGSAGGLTMGAVVNMAPELAKVALVHVPFVDVINTMLDESIPLTTQEFLEWGNPKLADQYMWMRSYSPYDNVGALDYPSMLVRTSLNDSQVPYWEATKWVARIRDLRKDSDPLLLKIDMDAGHGGASGRYKALEERAYDFAYLLVMLGVEKL